MYKVYFSNFYYYSVNISETIEGAKIIAKKAGFDSVIELNGEAICTYSTLYGFINVNAPEILLDKVG